jgi:hypothetical protein
MSGPGGQTSASKAPLSRSSGTMPRNLLDAGGEVCILRA